MTTMTSQVFTTTDLAARLGVSANMARRYGITWEKVTGETLPQMPGRGRMYSQDCMSAMEAARSWLLEHPNRSVEDALRTTLSIEEVEASPATAEAMEVSGALREALAQVLRESLAPVLRDLEAVRSENAELKRGLAALQAPNGGEAEVSDLRRRIRYLQMELERRDRREEVQQAHPWWRFWRAK